VVESYFGAIAAQDLDGMDLGRQLGVLPAAGSVRDRLMTAAFNAKTTMAAKIRELRS